MDYVKTVYVDGKQVRRPRIVSADNLNWLLLLAIEGLQNGEDYELHTEKAGPDDNVEYYKITFKRPGDDVVRTWFYEPYYGSGELESLFLGEECIPEWCELK